MSSLTLFQSYQDDGNLGRVAMKDSDTVYNGTLFAKYLRLIAHYVTLSLGVDLKGQLLRYQRQNS